VAIKDAQVSSRAIEQSRAIKSNQEQSRAIKAFKSNQEQSRAIAIYCYPELSRAVKGNQDQSRAVKAIRAIRAIRAIKSNQELSPGTGLPTGLKSSGASE
jgi:valyl-tRNA synthetase